jgi:hypothetical protein
LQPAEDGLAQGGLGMIEGQGKFAKADHDRGSGRSNPAKGRWSAKYTGSVEQSQSGMGAAMVASGPGRYNPPPDQQKIGNYHGPYQKQRPLAR